MYVLLTIIADPNSTSSGMMEGQALSSASPSSEESLETTAQKIGDDIDEVINQLQAAVGISSTNSNSGPLWDILFWSGIILASVMVLHVVLRALILWRKVKMPGVLAWPRMELSCLMALLPLVVATAAQLYSSNSSSAELAAAIIFAAVLPVVFIAAAVYLTVRYLALCPVEARKAHYVAPEGAYLVDDGSSTVDDSDTCSSSHHTNGTIMSQQALLDEVSNEPSRPVKRSAKFYMVKYVTKPLFGFDPDKMGEWVAPSHTEESFVNRWGVLFDSAQGPAVVYDKGTYEWDPGTETYVRYKPRPIAPETRLQQMKCIAQMLSTIVTTFKILLFINIMAGLSGQGSNVNPMVQIILLLVLTVVYWAYMRFLVPICDLMDLCAEVVSTACDFGTFVSGLILLFTAPDNVSQQVSLGWAMLVFQVVGLTTNIMMPAIKMTLFVWEVAMSILKKDTQSCRFREVVHEVILDNPTILVKRYADRWLVKVHRRGLKGRKLSHFERSASVLPFHLSKIASSNIFLKKDTFCCKGRTLD